MSEESHEHIPSHSELWGRVVNLEKMFAVHVEHCKQTDQKLERLCKDTEDLTKAVRDFNKVQARVAGAWWLAGTLAVIAVISIDIAMRITGMF